MGDAELVAAIRCGDEAAFSELHARYAQVLERYARRVLGRSEQHAEDVVQEAMLRAARALRRDDRAIELRPWLFRLTRNCALDELARSRTDALELSEAEGLGLVAHPESAGPEQTAERRLRLQEVLSDLAALPAQQRHVLLRREVDGLSHSALASELGISVQATKGLVHRARTNLARQREARDTACHAVRADLLDAHDGRRRASSPTYRHLAGCADCRRFRTALRRTRPALAILVPTPLVLGALLVLTGKVAAGSAKGAAAKAGATAAAGAAAAAGTVGLGIEVFASGAPAPQDARSPALSGGAVAKGARVPPGTAFVRRAVQVPAGGRTRSAELRCPPGLRVADLVGRPGASVSYSRDTVVGLSTRARVLVAGAPDGPGAQVAVTILCKAPDASGSVVANGRSRASSRAGAGGLRVGVRRAEVRSSPGGAALGSVRRGQPVRRLPARGRGRRDGWRRIETDTGLVGWVRGAILEPR